MSEIRDRVIRSIRELLFLNTLVDIAFQGGYIIIDEVELFLDYIEQEFLSIPELAYVDRKAELPRFLVDPKYTGVEIIRQYKDFLRKEGWVKEVEQ